MIYLIGKWFEILLKPLKIDLSKSKKVYKKKKNKKKRLFIRFSPSIKLNSISLHAIDIINLFL